MSLAGLSRKIVRIARDPLPRLRVIRYRLFGLRLMVWAYRKLVLPCVLCRVRHKKKITVVFLAMNPDMWRYDGVYRRLSADARFQPVVVTAMRNIPDMGVRLEEQEDMVAYFTKRGFDVVRGYDRQAHKWINLARLSPDIIFYTQPYNNCIESSFEYHHQLKSLLCYAPYSFQMSETKWGWDNNLQQYCWRLYYVGEVHMSVCKRLSRIGAVNAVPVGYSFEEEYEMCVQDKDAADGEWRHDRRKRIIWAPHHSIKTTEPFKVSSFLEIADLMVELRKEYKDKVIFAFKPHPILKTKLYQIWGVEKTDSYYASWATADNSFDAPGDYHALFAGSDGMIHCSGSFIVEYLYTGKPVAYVYSKNRKPPDIGPIGDAALKAHYSIGCEGDIRRFIDKVVIAGDDPMSGVRKETADRYLRSSNGKGFSENVYLDIVEGLGL